MWSGRPSGGKSDGVAAADNAVCGTGADRYSYRGARPRADRRPASHQENPPPCPPVVHTAGRAVSAATQPGRPMRWAPKGLL